MSMTSVWFQRSGTAGEVTREERLGVVASDATGDVARGWMDSSGKGEISSLGDPPTSQSPGWLNKNMWPCGTRKWKTIFLLIILCQSWVQ